jgi:hypothetical protein
MLPVRKLPDGRFEPLAEAAIPPGETLTVVLSAHVAPGTASFAHNLSFRTDHAEAPAASVRIQGTAFRGVVAVPESVAFPASYVGDPAIATVRLTDLRPDFARAGLRFEVDLPGVVVKEIDATGAKQARDHQVELTHFSTGIGRFAGGLTICSTDGATLGVVPISGRVIPEAELVPSIVLLPRPGNPDPNEARVLCRARTPVRLEIVDIPDGLSASIDDDQLIVRRSAAAGDRANDEFDSRPSPTARRSRSFFQ